MFAVRATKYDPTKRDARGIFHINEWTSISDIGKTFDGKELTPEDYLQMEDAYIAAIFQLLEATGLSCLAIELLENKMGPDARRSLQQLDTWQLRKKLGAIAIEGELDLEGIELISRLSLREALWCKLKGDHATYVHFGWDYYMYLGTEREGACLGSPPSGMHFETLKSPYAQTFYEG
ncbi:hypothetical protein C5Y96_07180 [Blastopirellula marina]|uniref:Uncharacterized protein n=1 Tax=Blastopirellula marina TaxID=124 RepID=A0A2S8FXP2_9BACT|nr:MULTISPECIES: hypothetical protein [Pirellulaceae]PQO36938.1 hypothetical protein C5Y96_07180 [Blastopirellula marina]RCS53653.1 hypothetical protein DTL36_07190 [Bremerella cremea]